MKVPGNQDLNRKVRATKSQVVSNEYSRAQSNWRGGPGASATPLRIKPF